MSKNNKPKPAAKTTAKPAPAPKPLKPEYQGLPDAPCEACGTPHPVPINHDHWQALRCKKPWPKKKQLNRHERNDKRMNAKRLPDASKFEVEYSADTQTWSGKLIIMPADDNSKSLIFNATASGVMRLLIDLDRMYRKHLTAKFAPVMPQDPPGGEA